MKLTKCALVKIIKEEISALPDFIEIKSQTNGIEQLLQSWLGRIRALQFWFHGAHHAATGTSFAGDHSILFDRIYSEILTEYDLNAEKCAGILDSAKVTCPIRVTKSALSILEKYPSPVELNSEEIVSVGCNIIKEHIAFIENLFDALESSNNLSLGFNDMLSAQANNFETYAYLLQQRTAKSN